MANMIVWLSEYPPLEVQQRELEALFGPITVVHVRPARTSAPDIAGDYHEAGASEMVAVVPRRLIAALVRCGLRPLWAQMDPCAAPGDLCDKGQSYAFTGFRRVVGVRGENELLFGDPIRDDMG